MAYPSPAASSVEKQADKPGEACRKTGLYPFI